MIDWLFTNALAALGLAIIAVVLIWTFRPAPAVRHALWLVVLLKLVSPTGLVVEVPLPVDKPTPAVVPPKSELVATPTDDFVVVQEEIEVVVTPLPGELPVELAIAQCRRDAEASETPSSAEFVAAADVAPPPPPATESELRSLAASFNYRPYLLGLWVAGAVLMATRQVRETARFARFTRRTSPASDALIAEVAVVANRLGVRVPAVRVMTGLTSPVIWCLWRPVLLWPAGLECRLKGEGRRAVLAHELAHLRRRDHWVRRLEMVASVLHWWNPLFWVARKKMRADAELACDAWAAGHADRRAYAEALLEVCSFNPRRRPAPAVGVFGEGRRAMQERLTMIMRDRVPCRLAFGAKLLIALMAIAAVPAWTLGPVQPAAAQSDAQVEELQRQIKMLAAKLEALKAEKAASAEAEKAKKTKAIEAQSLDEAKKLYAAALEKAQAAGNKTVKDVIVQGQGVKVITAGEEGYKVIGPDGKEIKDVKIIISPKPGAVVKPSGQGSATKVPMVVDTKTGKYTFVPSTTANVKPGTAFQLSPDGKTYSWTTKAGGAGGQTVTLSRATYKLNKEQGAALATLLGSIKAGVLETKIDGDSITITTTPDIQGTISQIVRLVQGQAGQSTFEYKFVPASPTKPTAPTAPVKPTKPAKPEKPFVLELNDLDMKLDVLKSLPLQLEIDPATGKPNAEKLKELKIELEKLKDMKELKELKFDKIEIEKLKDLEKLKELENLKDLKDVEKLKDAIKLLVPADKVKRGSDNKPEGPAK